MDILLIKAGCFAIGVVFGVVGIMVAVCLAHDGGEKCRKKRKN